MVKFIEKLSYKNWHTVKHVFRNKINLISGFCEITSKQKEKSLVMVYQIRDDQGEYYCLKKDIDFFINYQYNNLSGQIVRELSTEELEKEFNQTSCFVLSKEQFKYIENDDIYCNYRKTRNGFIPIVSVMIGMICVIFYIIRIFK